MKNTAVTTFFATAVCCHGIIRFLLFVACVFKHISLLFPRSRQKCFINLWCRSQCNQGRS